MEFPPEITLVVKAFVVFAVCLIQSEKFRMAMTGKRKRRLTPAEREVTQHG